MRSNFNWQQIPFGMAMHNLPRGWNPGVWTWSYDLGMSTIQAFSFCGHGAPEGSESRHEIGFTYVTSGYPAEKNDFTRGCRGLHSAHHFQKAFFRQITEGAGPEEEFP